jgi:hypothetical protein
MKTVAITAGLLAALLLANTSGLAQPWNYNFGTATGSLSTNGADSLLIIPAPALNGGKARIRVGSGGGSFNLENQVIAFGSDSYLRGVAPTGSSVNKFSVYNFTPGQAFTLRFRVRFGASDGSATASSGTWSLFIGDGERYSDNLLFVGSQVFTGIQWQFGTSGMLNTRYRNAGAWSTSGLLDTPFVQGQSFLVEIYGNSSTGELPYTYNSAQTVAPGTFDLWVDGVLAGDNLPKGQIADGSSIDSWMFYGESSTGNAANIFIDDVMYQNAIAESPLSVELASFSAVADGANTVTVTWRTLTETSNHGFSIQKSTDGKSFVEVSGGFVPGHNTSLEPHDYLFVDRAAEPGAWYYRLCQIDMDGTMHYTGSVRVEVITGVAGSLPVAFRLQQNWPNPFNPTTSIGYTVGVVSGQWSVAGRVRLAVYDLLGREVAVLVDERKEPGTYTATWDATNTACGVYIYRLAANNSTLCKTMVLLK